MAGFDLSDYGFRWLGQPSSAVVYKHRFSVLPVAEEHALESRVTAVSFEAVEGGEMSIEATIVAPDRETLERDLEKLRAAGVLVVEPEP